jgi:general secretion pathway protein B
VSLILDALRRADSERERGAVPGLHAQPVPVALPEPRAAARQPPWPWLAAAAVVASVAGLAWLVAGREAPPPMAASAVSPPAAAGVPAAPAIPAPVAADARGAAATAPPAAAVAPRAAASEAQPVAEPAPWPAPERRSPPAASAAVSAGAPQAQASADAPNITRDQLPADIRAQLPPLVVGGSIYSASPADRSLIIDGRILRENERLNADLALEQIRPKSAVLRFKGYRFEIGY